jgi:hypothetical protein
VVRCRTCALASPFLSSVAADQPTNALMQSARDAGALVAAIGSTYATLFKRLRVWASPSAFTRRRCARLLPNRQILTAVQYEWQQTVCDNTGLQNLPLWYANYDGQCWRLFAVRNRTNRTH